MASRADPVTPVSVCGMVVALVVPLTAVITVEPSLPVKEIEEPLRLV